jgi:hypothetical protein
MAVFNIVHTKYQYNCAITESSTEIKLFPYNFENQKCYNFSFRSQKIQVAISKIYGNRVGNFNILGHRTDC